MPTARLRKILPLLCPVLSSLCLGAGYLPTGVWAGVIASLTFLLWMAARRWKALWTANLGLSAATAAAAYGLTIGAGLVWMLPAAALGLASWDLALLEARLATNSPGIQTDGLVKTHLACLSLALGLSLLVALLGQMIRFQIPFVVMLALVALAYLSLDRLLRSLREGKDRL